MKYKCIVPLLSFALVPLLLAAPESAKSAPAAVKVVSYDAGVVLTVDLLKQGKNTEAQAQARKLVSQNHTRYEGHLYLGITYFNQSDYNAAEAELNQALSLAPQPFKADVQQALTLTINTRTHDSSLAEAQRALADGLKSKAAKLFAEAANSLPSDTATALKAAQLEYDQGSFLDAADLAAAGRAGTDNADSKAQAQALLDKWHSNYSTAADIRYRQALELAKQGKFEAALPSLEKAAPLLTRPQDGGIVKVRPSDCSWAKIRITHQASAPLRADHAGHTQGRQDVTYNSDTNRRHVSISSLRSWVSVRWLSGLASCREKS